MEASKEASMKIDKVVQENTMDIIQVVEKVEATEKQVKFEVFGKC